MNVIKLLSTRPYSVSELKDDVPSENNIVMVCSDMVVKLDGKIIAVYKKADFDLEQVRAAAVNMEYSSYVRTNGLITQTEGINSIPRNPRRTNKCSRTKLRVSQPELHQMFLDLAKQLAKAYREYFPGAYAQQVKALHVGTKKVHEDYRIRYTPFTGGVVNKDSQLGFHRDNANTPDGISCMLCLKKGMAGGGLVLPELGIGFECQDGYMLLFDGQKYIHGVTPFIPLPGREAYRITIVFYNSKGMELCLPLEQEELFYRHQLELKSGLTFEE